MDVWEDELIGSVVLFVFGVAMGVACIWDVGGFATMMRTRIEEKGGFGALYRRLPWWTFRTFGVWCIVFGIGQLIFVYATTHGSKH